MVEALTALPPMLHRDKSRSPFVIATIRHHRSISDKTAKACLSGGFPRKGAGSIPEIADAVGQAGWRLVRQGGGLVESPPAVPAHIAHLHCTCAKLLHGRDVKAGI